MEILFALRLATVLVAVAFFVAPMLFWSQDDA